MALRVMASAPRRDGTSLRTLRVEVGIDSSPRLSAPPEAGADGRLSVIQTDIRHLQSGSGSSRPAGAHAALSPSAVRALLDREGGAHRHPPSVRALSNAPDMR